MSLIELTDEKFKEEVIDSKIPVAVDFWAEWCGPCRNLGLVYEELSKEYDGKIKFVKINVGKNSGLTSKYGILSIPTILYFKNGNVVNQTVGYIKRDNLKSEIEKLLK